jgi:hypothetical protein
VTWYNSNASRNSRGQSEKSEKSEFDDLEKEKLKTRTKKKVFFCRVKDNSKLLDCNINSYNVVCREWHNRYGSGSKIRRATSEWLSDFEQWDEEEKSANQRGNYGSSLPTWLLSLLVRIRGLSFISRKLLRSAKINFIDFSLSCCTTTH